MHLITFVTWLPHWPWNLHGAAEVIEKVRPDGLFAAFGEDLRELEPIRATTAATATTA